MQEIRYSRAKMWLAAIFFGHAAVFLSVLIYDPQLAQPGRYGFLVQSALGHFVVLPLLTVLSAVVAISGVAVALGPGLAIVADSEGVSVTTVWRSHRVAWTDLLRVRLEATTVRRRTFYSLKFDRCRGGTISLPLSGLDVPHQMSDYLRLAEALSETHLSALNRPAVTSTTIANSTSHHGERSPPVRPAFGRKTM